MYPIHVMHHCYRQKGGSGPSSSRISHVSKVGEMLRLIDLSLAVLDDGVDGVVRDAADGALLSLRGNVLAEALDRLAQTKEVGGDTGDVGRSHGGTRDGVGLTAGPGRLDVGARGEDIDERSVVGEVGEGVSVVGSTNSADGRLRGGGRVGGVLGLVAGGDSHEVTGAHDIRGRIVDGG